MAARFWRAAARKAARSCPSATREPSATPPEVARPFPKERRILRSTEFRKVYDQGWRFSGPLFLAFCLHVPGLDGPKVGFTAPRALGRSVVRNRIKRRMREAVRLHLSEVGTEWEIVVNPRRSAQQADFSTLEREVLRLFARCNASSSAP
ncbi:MAG TPA: ribonuclease P protein component [Solibacterales bacterium]|nr:ribonuclease P protein component [Bryobacterales bacterium]